MGETTLKELLEAGVHFGHQTKRWNPKMKPYIFMDKNGIHIINLQKTMVALENAKKAIEGIASKGGKVLFLGTKTQAKNAVKEEATRSGMPYVCERWLGGTLTNFNTVRKSLSKLEELEAMEEDGRMEQFKKKEALKMNKEKEKLLKALGGIRTMSAVPEMVFIIDTKKEINAVKEARKLKIPIVGLIDTNADPDEVDYPIPANDDAMRAISLFCKSVADSILEGSEKYREGQEIAKAIEQKADDKKAGDKKAPEKKPAGAKDGAKKAAPKKAETQKAEGKKPEAKPEKPEPDNKESKS